ncbi:toxin ParE1/3/4 [Rhizomicrobium palustre]|uniref:Toxin ParE1/3/4 n=1 Tax=Rhizomicrobium palustre TaxID=189966 RepID=A0A846MVI4_9PROT|nr:type II toxin-antitoxin system RelE/ParE family toxin [Rhizomicrobium palustre]NIK87017.1 toxin ParE1/3/4 [Rhizomicrobium palustre]
MKPAILEPRARKDLLEAVRWIAKDNPKAAAELRKAVAAAAGRIGTHPGLGVERPDITEEPIRFLILTGYPYIIAYDPFHAPPLILRVLHGARDIPHLMGR